MKITLQKTFDDTRLKQFRFEAIDADGKQLSLALDRVEQEAQKGAIAEALQTLLWQFDDGERTLSDMMQIEFEVDDFDAQFARASGK